VQSPAFLSDFPSSLDRALQEHVAVGCPGAILAVSAPTLGVDLTQAAGLFARGGSRPLRPTDAFRAASVTKAVTAATAVTLASQGRWTLDDAVARWLPSPVLKSLRHLKGLESTETLSLRRLLGHTSGLPDYFFDPQFQARVEADPDRVWHSEDLVEAAVGVGTMLFPPGSGFAYVDTGYVLVGIAIEHLLDRPLSETYRSLIFDPLGMADTYLEWHEPARGPDLVASLRRKARPPPGEHVV
jgi:D-alanyl-D-alanine carboxypeptidase